MDERKCIKCTVQLEAGENWYSTHKAVHYYICIACFNRIQNAYNTKFRSDRSRVYRNKVVYCDHPECARIDRQSVLERGDFTCGICHDPIGDDPWHMDHIIPVSKKGPHCYYNLQPSHPTCNMIKGDTILVE